MAPPVNSAVRSLLVDLEPLLTSSSISERRVRFPIDAALWWSTCTTHLSAFHIDSMSHRRAIGYPSRFDQSTGGNCERPAVLGVKSVKGFAVQRGKRFEHRVACHGPEGERPLDAGEIVSTLATPVSPPLSIVGP